MMPAKSTLRSSHPGSRPSGFMTGGERTVDFNPYRQVEVLLGRRIKRGKKRGQLAEFVARVCCAASSAKQ